MKFEGQLALVTGASRGIGAATALALARNGAHVVITARSADGLEKLEEQIHEAGGHGSLAPVPAIDGKEFNKLLTLNLIAQQALIAGFDPMLRKSDDARLLAMTSSVGRKPRAFWGAYGASKAALETLVLSYGEEMRNLGKIRTAIVDPGRTRTEMRASAYPGEDPASVKLPEVVADRLVEILASDFETGKRFEIS